MLDVLKPVFVYQEPVGLAGMQGRACMRSFIVANTRREYEYGDFKEVSARSRTADHQICGWYLSPIGTSLVFQ